MKKRSGAILISTIVLLIVVLIMTLASVALYSSTSKQSYMAKNHTQAHYLSVSGLNIVGTYIVKNNDAFKVKYNEHLDMNANDRLVPMNFTLDNLDISDSENSIDINIISKKDEVITDINAVTDDEKFTYVTIYEINSVGSYEGAIDKSLYIEIIERTYKGKTIFEVGQYSIEKPSSTW